MLMQMSPPDENLTTAAANDAGIDAGAVCVVLCVLHGLRPPDNSDGIVLHALGDRCKERARERETKKVV